MIEYFLLSAESIPYVDNIEDYSIAIVTVLIGLIDGFNPCSLWVLSVLLGLVIHVSRKKVIFVGLSFLMTTAVVYGLFVGGVLSVMSVMSHIDYIQVIVGLFALLFAVVSIKDFIWFNKGISFTIPDSKKPDVYRKIRQIPKKDGYISTFVFTVVIASGIAIVELPCTAGFPVVWGNMVADAEVGMITYIVLLILYIAMYLLIEIIIFLLAVFTLDSVNYSSTHGQVLKLIGGNIMLFLAFSLFFYPQLLENITLTIIGFLIVIIMSLIISYIAYRFDHFENK